MSRIEDIEARLNAATSGPWMGPRITDQWPPGWIGVYAAYEDGSPIPGDIVGVTGRCDEDEANANATLIAHVPDDLEYLLKVAKAVVAFRSLNSGTAWLEWASSTKELLALLEE